ncbi:hypothetical protein BC826DRAFT_43647 [Russula brevipes]|nr:hypothetical protein BC826DRAFT_318920 [Russula brevipes]KAI0287519.1 hypothetical protein BC826DRAFT_43647 [Russula brevipes]
MHLPFSALLSPKYLELPLDLSLAMSQQKAPPPPRVAQQGFPRVGTDALIPFTGRALVDIFLPVTHASTMHSALDCLLHLPRNTTLPRLHSSARPTPKSWRTIEPYNWAMPSAENKDAWLASTKIHLNNGRTARRSSLCSNRQYRWPFVTLASRGLGLSGGLECRECVKLRLAVLEVWMADDEVGAVDGLCADCWD